MENVDELKELKKYKIIDKSIIIISYLYLAVPIIMLLAFWFKPYISILTIVALIISLVFALKKFKYKTIEQYKKIFNIKKIIIMIILIVILNILSGAGGICHQNWDYRFRNAVFHDLIDYDWPVKYDFSQLNYESEKIGSDIGVLNYYFAYWLPSAAIGKIFGFHIASLFILLWQTLGVTLFFYLLFRKLDNIKFKYFLIFLAFGGLDIITKFIVCIKYGQPLELLGTFHIDTANDAYCMSTFITQLFWVFNQSIPAWIITMLLVNEKKFSNLGILLALLVPYSPFPVIGLAIWIIITILFGFDLNEKINKKRIKELFSVQNVLGVLSVIPIGLMFLLNSNEKGFVLWRAFKNGILLDSLFKYLLFIILEFGVYALILNKQNKRKVLTYFLIFSILPLFYLGIGVDLGNRATIPILILLYIEVVKFLDSKKYKKRQILVWIILVIAFLTNFNEIYRSISFTKRNYEYNFSNFDDSYHTFSSFGSNKECEKLIKNFVSPYDTKEIFFSKIFK